MQMVQLVLLRRGRTVEFPDTIRYSRWSRRANERQPANGLSKYPLRSRRQRARLCMYVCVKPSDSRRKHQPCQAIPGRARPPPLHVAPTPSDRESALFHTTPDTQPRNHGTNFDRGRRSSTTNLDSKQTHAQDWSAMLCCAVLCSAVLCCPACPETEFHFPLPTPGKCRLCQSAYTLPTNARDPPWDAYQVTHLSNVLQIARDVLPAFYMTRPTNS
ncbi:hypothetical protein VFPBJ_07188 [Purpureocillium lilacinum]|uniref:Uncharacterized protein n=1 Tax=Purpureocillium lilacinum TaxID=33203 RepID=A0A179GMD4_PURLI|nr:hypothetical protein VFPBJ_07188 [Purpureocillium lilacinum]